MGFFERNEVIILFAQGLAFFALGFAVWLHRRRATRLRLTSSLIWLAAFAVCEALAVWGFVFVPIQQDYLSAGLVEWLVVLRAVLQTVAFLFLVQFGLRLVDISSVRRRALTGLSIGAWLTILATFTALGRSYGWSAEEWAQSVSAASRYLLLVPGAVLSAAGLWRQRSVLAAAGMPGIRPFAAVAAVVLGIYALIGGLVVEPAPWAPPFLNEDDWLAATGFQIQALRGLAGLALAAAAVKLLEIFEVEDGQRLEALDRARAVAEERSRFSRDLHDGTIQSIYAAGLNLEAVALRTRDDGLRRDVRGIVAQLNGVTDGIRDYIRDLTRTPDTVEGISASLEELCARFASDSEVAVLFRSRGSTAAGLLPEDAGRHLQQILREGLSNAARHAAPRVVHVELAFAQDEIELTVSDDGAGFRGAATNGDQTGYGVRNMRERARRMGGRLTIHPRPGGGTVVAISVPLDADVPAEADGPGSIVDQAFTR